MSATSKTTFPSASTPGGNLSDDLSKISQETRADAVSMAKFQREQALTQMWSDAQKQHSDQIRTGARA